MTASAVLTYDDLPRKLNLASWFLDRRVEEGGGDRTALIVSDGAEHTYADVAALANRTGHILRDLGVRPEERVLIALSDGLEFVASWYAVLKIGGVVAEVYTFLQPKDYAYYLSYTRARVVVVDRETLEPMREAAALSGRPRRLLVVGVPEEELRDDEVSFERLVAGAPDALEPEPTTRDDIAIWKFTTGSTGAPKAAVHAVHDPIISFECYAKGVVGYREDDRVLPVPKLFFGYGRDATTLFPFGVGATGIVFPERSTPERLFDLIARHRPTILVQVPSMMRSMVAHPEAGAQDLSSLRLCLSSGEALPGELYRRWQERFGVEVIEGVGSSEAYHIYLSNRPGATRPGSAGEVVPGYTATLVDGDGREVADGEPGELHVRGESTALMYWNDHPRSKRTFAADLVRTGDLFQRDADGYFWYRGRADDLLKVRGIWIAPSEIEDRLLEHPDVLECAVVGVEDADGLSVPRAYVVLRDGDDATEETARALQDFVRDRLSRHKYPREIRFLDELPKAATGKLDRKALRTAHDTDRARRAAGAGRDGEREGLRCSTWSESTSAGRAPTASSWTTRGT
jgi:benzoate-CoA ligase family protein